LENILVTTDKNSEVVFKIADLGLFQFRKGDDAFDIFLGAREGTKTFGAPEAHRGDNETRTRLIITNKSDIWSLCCIFSVVAAWSVHGFQEIERYSNNRSEELNRRSALINANCFHDGENVISTVFDMHDIIRSTCNADDHVTRKVLDLIEEVLLKSNPETRFDAETLHAKCRRIIADAKKVEYQHKMEGIQPNSPHLTQTPEREVTSRPPPPVRPPPTHFPRTSIYEPPENAIVVHRRHASGNEEFNSTTDSKQVAEESKPEPLPHFGVSQMSRLIEDNKKIFKSLRQSAIPSDYTLAGVLQRLTRLKDYDHVCAPKIQTLSSYLILFDKLIFH
jgi:hypothetical protein